MWVIFEGLDKAGKTTLEWELLKATNYKYIVVDRGPVGYLSFDKILNRETKESNNEFIHLARKMMKSKDYMVVYCYADTNVVEERLEQHGELLAYDYNKAQKIYRRNIERYYCKDKVIMLDTTRKSVNECVEIIIKKLKEA